MCVYSACELFREKSPFFRDHKCEKIISRAHKIFEFISDRRHLARLNGTSEIFEEIGASVFVTWHMTGSMTMHHYCAHLLLRRWSSSYIRKVPPYSRYILSATIRCAPNLYCANYTRLVVAQFVARDKERPRWLQRLRKLLCNTQTTN